LIYLLLFYLSDCYVLAKLIFFGFSDGTTCLFFLPLCSVVQMLFPKLYLFTIVLIGA